MEGRGRREREGEREREERRKERKKESTGWASIGDIFILNVSLLFT